MSTERKNGAFPTILYERKRIKQKFVQPVVVRRLAISSLVSSKIVSSKFKWITAIIIIIREYRVFVIDHVDREYRYNGHEHHHYLWRERRQMFSRRNQTKKKAVRSSIGVVVCNRLRSKSSIFMQIHARTHGHTQTEKMWFNCSWMPEPEFGVRVWWIDSRNIVFNTHKAQSEAQAPCTNFKEEENEEEKTQPNQNHQEKAMMSNANESEFPKRGPNCSANTRSQFSCSNSRCSRRRRKEEGKESATRGTTQLQMADDEGKKKKKGKIQESWAFFSHWIFLKAENGGYFSNCTYTSLVSHTSHRTRPNIHLSSK